MVEGIIAAMVLITAFIGFRLFTKVREMSSWKPDADYSSGTTGKSIPQELRDLKIESPSDNLTELSDGDQPAGQGDAEAKPKT